MAYQNVGTPIFYVDILSWLKSKGMIEYISPPYNIFESINGLSLSSPDATPHLLNLLGINPTKDSALVPPGNGEYYLIYNTNLSGGLSQIMYEKNSFSMILGHNLKTTETAWAFGSIKPNLNNYSQLTKDNYINAEWVSAASAANYDGFSIARGDNVSDADESHIIFIFNSIINQLVII